MKRFPELPGPGGATKTAPEDFLVEERPAYAPSGQGAHTLLFVEKRGLTTEEMLVELCRVAKVPRNDAGAAGMKDRQAVTRQWVSLPNIDPDVARAWQSEKWRVLEAARHENKLKTGHLRGNRFTIVLRGLRCDVGEGVKRANAIMAALARDGLPNFFGAQRFGVRGDNASFGRALVDGKSTRVSRGERRLYVSALQAELFNAYLERRLQDGLVATFIDGDILRKRESGGLFSPSDVQVEDARARLASHQIDVTGPMFGHAMRAPAPGSPSAAREEQLLAGNGLSAAAFTRLGPIAEGTRRPLVVPVNESSVEVGTEPNTLRVSFVLPPGAYATILLEELTQP